MPRVLARLPYAAKTEPVEEFAFEEDTDGHKGEKYAWMNAAYAWQPISTAPSRSMAVRAHPRCAIRRRGGGFAGAHVPTDDGGVDMKCPTEIAISDRREAELAKSGLIR